MSPSRYDAANTAQAPTLESISPAPLRSSRRPRPRRARAAAPRPSPAHSPIFRKTVATVTLQLTPGSSGQLALRSTFAGIDADAAELPVITSPSNQTASLNLTVTPRTADLSVALAKTSHAIRIGKAATVSAVVRDLGPQPALGTKVVFGVPGTVKLVRFTGTGFICSAVARTCTVASVTSSSSARIVLSLVPTKAGIATAVCEGDRCRGHGSRSREQHGEDCPHGSPDSSRSSTDPAGRAPRSQGATQGGAEPVAS